MELIDVLLPDGTPAGIRKTKDEIHRDGDWHRSVHVWIMTPERQLLLQRRSLEKENHPGLWDVSAAGHLSAGEDSISAAVREVEEEIGLSVAPAEFRYLATFRESFVLNEGTYLDNEIHDVLLVERDVDPDSLVLQPGEVDQVALVEPSSLLERALVPHEEEYALILRIAGDHSRRSVRVPL
ncbi:MAG TPA: NUDIX domain-containing protein [Thermoanaerobaculia bacterium]|nr:NUDIX domain-containing protein [Thermoanaerobaculia bacterium]